MVKRQKISTKTSLIYNLDCGNIERKAKSGFLTAAWLFRSNVQAIMVDTHVIHLSISLASWSSLRPAVSFFSFTE
jgi:hypothetical protein